MKQKILLFILLSILSIRCSKKEEVNIDIPSSLTEQMLKRDLNNKNDLIIDLTNTTGLIIATQEEFEKATKNLLIKKEQNNFSNSNKRISADCGLTILKDYCDGRYDFKAASCFPPATETRYYWYFQKEGESQIYLGYTDNQPNINFSGILASSGKYRIRCNIYFYDYPSNTYISYWRDFSYVAIMAPPPSTFPGTKPFLRYYTIKGSDHFYTTNWCELASGTADYTFERIEGNIFQATGINRVPLYQYYNPKIWDHFYTTDFSVLGTGKFNYIYEGITGYVYPTSQPSSIPLYGSYNSKLGDHFYTTNLAEATSSHAAGYIDEGITCYVIR